MLISFQIKNYRSILDVTIPMVYAEKKAPNGYEQMDLFPFLEEKNMRVVPCLAVYGANASGKSNIVNAFSLISTIVKDKYYPIAFAPNKLHANTNTTEFTLEFISSGRKFLYTLQINHKEIVVERLIQDSECIFSIEERTTQFERLATEVYPETKLNTIFTVECLDQEKEFRTPFITIVGGNYAGLNSSMSDAFMFITKRLEVYGDNRFPFTLGLNRLAKTDTDSAIQHAFAQIVSILQKLDIDINRMEYERNELKVFDKIQLGNDYEYVHNLARKALTSTEIHTYHTDVSGNEVQFDFQEESSGTQRVACLLGVVLSVLEHGNVLIIDELGNSLHPFLFSEIVRMFKDKRYNTTNAQLLFTTHNTDIMDQDMMRVSEIGIVNKTLKRGTTFQRISDFEGVRNVTKFRKQYIEGNFSGIPYPYI